MFKTLAFAATMAIATAAPAVEVNVIKGYHVPEALFAP
jgi:hypothetical protein